MSIFNKQSINNMGKTKKRLLVWGLIVAVILAGLFGVMQISDEMNWSLFDFAFVGVALFGAGVLFEVLARNKGGKVYRAAFIIGLLGAFLLAWVNGAVGIIGNENQDANLLFSAVFAVGFIGSLIARFKAQGMAKTLFAAALVQILVPVVALIIWPPSAISWSPGVFKVFLFASFFALLFLTSAFLFKRSVNN